MKNLITTSIALAVIACFGSPAAQAGNGISFYGGFGSSHHGNGFGNGYGNSGYSGYNRGFQGYGQNGYGVQNYGRSWGQQGHYGPHTTTHYDYHAPSIQRHGNHFDFVPGHYDPHTTTHYGYHRGH